ASQAALQPGYTLRLEYLSHCLLRGEDPGQADGAQSLMYYGSQGPLALALCSRPLLDLRDVSEEGVGQDRGRANDQQGQLPVEPQEHGTHADEEEDTGQNLDEGVSQNVPKGL